MSTENTPQTAATARPTADRTESDPRTGVARQSASDIAERPSQHTQVAGKQAPALAPARDAPTHANAESQSPAKAEPNRAGYIARERIDRDGRDREAQAKDDEATHQRERELAALERAMDAGNRASAQRTRLEVLGTAVGAAGFAAAVSDRVREKISELPALATSAAQHLRLPSNDSRGDPSNTARDSRLQHEATEVLIAARSVGIQRESDRPGAGNGSHVELIERELNLRRSLGESVRKNESHVTADHYQKGARVLHSMSVEKQGEKTRERIPGGSGTKNEMEMD